MGVVVFTWARVRAGFASGEIAPGYEGEARGRKRRLFDGVFQTLPRGAAVLEVGPGSLPNAAFYTSLRHADVIGVDPNDQVSQERNDSPAHGMRRTLTLC